MPVGRIIKKAVNICSNSMQTIRTTPYGNVNDPYYIFTELLSSVYNSQTFSPNLLLLLHSTIPET